MKHDTSKAKYPYTIRIAGPMGTLTIQRKDKRFIKVDITYLDISIAGPTSVSTQDWHFSSADHATILYAVGVSRDSFRNAVNTVLKVSL